MSNTLVYTENTPDDEQYTCSKNVEVKLLK